MVLVLDEMQTASFELGSPIPFYEDNHDDEYRVDLKTITFLRKILFRKLIFKLKLTVSNWYSFLQTYFRGLNKWKNEDKKRYLVFQQ